MSGKSNNKLNIFRYSLFLVDYKYFGIMLVYGLIMFLKTSSI